MKIDNIPLNAFVSRAGVCSRRAAVNLIQNGQIKVNGEVVTEPGYKVKSGDKVEYKDQGIRPEKKIYILFNKPKGCITTLSDERKRNTIMNYINIGTKERIYPVGRLDRDTTGLIVITNDGDLAQHLAHPKNKVPKCYYVALDKPVSFDCVTKLRRGVYLEDGRAFVDKIKYANLKTKNSVVVEIHGGKKRIIKRMFSHLGYKVIGLDRFGYANLSKKGLLPGRWRYLTDTEIESLRNF